MRFWLSSFFYEVAALALAAFILFFPVALVAQDEQQTQESQEPQEPQEPQDPQEPQPGSNGETASDSQAQQDGQSAPEGQAPPKEETVELNLKPKALTSEEIDAKIEAVRETVSQSPDNKEAKFALSDLLVQKAAAMRGKPFGELENLFFEASDLAPENFNVTYRWADALFANKNFENAISKFDQALAIKPDHLDCLMKMGISQMNMMKYEDAVGNFDKAKKQIPTDFYLLYCTGKCHFELKDYDKAVEAWEEALKQSPGKQSAEAVQQLIRQAKEQDASIAGTTKDENQRFIVHYAGNSQQDIGDMTMEILEDIYDQVTSDLMLKPEIQINVIFFRTEEFYEINKAASWVRALAKGEKIFVPLRQGCSDMNSIKGILAHEFTHVIINLRTNSRCPVWINEGLAVYEEFQASFGDPTHLRSDYEKFFQTRILNDHTFIPLKQINLNPSRGAYGEHIPLGYLESYLSVRFIIERFGWQGIDQLLTSLAQGNGLDEVLTTACNMSFNDFEREFFDWMKGL